MQLTNMTSLILLSMELLYVASFRNMIMFSFNFFNSVAKMIVNI